MIASIKTYVINLPEAVQRKRFMKAQLVHFPFLEVEFLPAIRGVDIPPKEVDRIVDYEHCHQLLGRSLTLPEIGCALSHLEVMGRIERENIRQAMVLEDDAIISGTLIELFPRLVDAFQSDRPRILLLTPCTYFVSKGRTIYEHFAIRPVFEAWGATGYMINFEAAKILRKALLPLYTVADRWVEIRRATGIKIDTLVPYCIGISISKNTASYVQPVSNKDTSIKAGQVSKHAAALACCMAFINRVKRGIFERVVGIKPHRIVF